MSVLTVERARDHRREDRYDDRVAATNKNKKQEYQYHYTPERGGGTIVLPWLLFLATLGGAGYLAYKVHWPLMQEAKQKDQSIAQLMQANRTLRATEEELQKARGEVERMQADLQRSASQKAQDDQLLAQLKKDLGDAEMSQDAAGQITVTMVDRILFKSGDAALTPAGQELLLRLGAVLANADKLIEVSGHADNQPIENEHSMFATNWELSTTRATNVARFLQEKVGIKPRRLKAAGYSSYRPVASNATAKGRAKNRRIELLLLPDNMKVEKLAAAAAARSSARPELERPHREHD